MLYTEWKREMQRRVDALPIFCAFTQAQLDKELAERNATTDDIYSLGAGTYYLKKDADLIMEWDKDTSALDELMKEHDFAVSAFYEEMKNHEYSINYYQRNWDVLNCFSDEELEYTNTDDIDFYLEQMGHTEWKPWYMEARKKYYATIE